MRSSEMADHLDSLAPYQGTNRDEQTCTDLTSTKRFNELTV